LRPPPAHRCEGWLDDMAEQFGARYLPMAAAILTDWLGLAQQLRAQACPHSAPAP